jgi:hypothetical protein
MKKSLAFAGAAVLAVSTSPLAAQWMQQPTPAPQIPTGVTPIVKQRLHDPNAEAEAQRLPTPGGPQDRRPAAPAGARPSASVSRPWLACSAMALR